MLPKAILKKSQSPKTKARVILASASPRRVELLTSLGLKFDVIPSRVEEVIDRQLSPKHLVESLASQKADYVFSSVAKGNGDLIVIGADTMVFLDGDLLGKPLDQADAKRMLIRLSGRTHTVFTGVAMIARINGGVQQSLAAVEETRVTFRNLEKQEIIAYISAGESMDKAGAYALQGVGAALISAVQGCYTNVIGLPIPKVVSMLRQLGVTILALPACQEDINEDVSLPLDKAKIGRIKTGRRRSYK